MPHPNPPVHILKQVFSRKMEKIHPKDERLVKFIMMKTHVPSESPCINHQLQALFSQSWEFYHKPSWPMANGHGPSNCIQYTFALSNAHVQCPTHIGVCTLLLPPDITAPALPLLLSASKLPFGYVHIFKARAMPIRTNWSEPQWNMQDENYAACGKYNFTPQ